MTLRQFLGFAALSAGALACSDSTAPTHTPIYEWRYFALDPVNNRTDTLSFHWPASMLPVKIWVQDTLGMPGHIQDAVNTWRSIFLYGEYDAVLVPDSLAADVVVHVGQPPPKSVATLARLHTMFPGCGGETDFDTGATNFQLMLPVRVYIIPKYDPATSDLSECFAITTTHEIGHSLGLFQHTSDTLDIMYSLPQATALSVRDINTATVLSHWPANLIPTR